MADTTPRNIVKQSLDFAGPPRIPYAMGGGTYARMIPNTVAVGAGWEGNGPAHENDERVSISQLYKMSRVYARLFYRLMTIEE